MSQPPPRDEPMLSEGLTAHLRTVEPVGDCPDAETLAVYADGDASSDERAQVEAHLVSCRRCQMHMAALARTEPPAAAAPASSFVWSWRWLVPLASAALIAVAVWVARTPPPAPPAIVANEAPASPPAAEAFKQEASAQEARPQNQTAPTDKAAPKPAAAAARAREELAKGNVAEPSVEARYQAAPAPPPPPAAVTPQAPGAAAMGARGDRVATDELKAAATPVWRLANGFVERTADGGASWTDRFQPSGASLRAIAGVSPTACWAVGDDGAVFRTTDGVGWVRVPFPERIPLVSVDASNAETATVTAADGRRFITSDGGTTWRPR